MRKEYIYSNLKQETNTSGKVMLEPSKKTKKRKTRIRQEQKPPRWFTNFANEVTQSFDKINKRLDNMDQRLSNVESILKRNNIE